MAPVLENQALLKEIIGEEGDKEGGLEGLVKEVVGEVYEVVDGLMEEMEFLLEEGWDWEGIEGVGETKGKIGGENLKRDHEYLVKMKEMDQEIERRKTEGGMEKRGLEISEVVPVAGLVMGRLHVYNCEVNTVIGHWGEGTEEGGGKEEGEKLSRSKEWAGMWKAAQPALNEEKEGK